ncbi:MAG: hypothetical protein ACLQDY_05665 [Streptosporangiaceae bacterium]
MRAACADLGPELADTTMSYYEREPRGVLVTAAARGRAGRPGRLSPFRESRPLPDGQPT